MRLQTALSFYYTLVWFLVLGHLVFKMLLQTAHALHFSLVLDPWSSGIWKEAANCTLYSLQSGPWSSGIWNEATSCSSFLSTAVWFLVLGHLVFEMRLQTALVLHLSVSWSLVVLGRVNDSSESDSSLFAFFAGEREDSSKMSRTRVRLFTRVI
jgi:hypothetical protein